MKLETGVVHGWIVSIPGTYDGSCQSATDLGLDLPGGQCRAPSPSMPLSQTLSLGGFLPQLCPAPPVMGRVSTTGPLVKASKPMWKWVPEEDE